MNVGFVAMAALGVGCAALQAGACGSDEDGASGDLLDTHPEDIDATDGVPTTAATDVEVSSEDALPNCVDIECEPFEHCIAGGCAAYGSCWFNGTCDDNDEVCRAGYCVPGDVDIDGDGAAARDDCDETSTAIHPLADETCNGVDDDCDGETDEGDASAMCDGSGTGDLCLAGACACADGAVDLDPEVPGCECLAAPTPDQGLACNSSIELGDLPDVGARVVIEGTLVPAEREVWYHFRGVDEPKPETVCDNYNVRVVFESDPESAYEFNACHGACYGECLTQWVTDYTWATDFRKNINGQLVGQCPCTGPGTVIEGVDPCKDDTDDYFVRVRRRPGTALRCSPYRIEISNGRYDTP